MTNASTARHNDLAAAFARPACAKRIVIDYHAGRVQLSDTALDQLLHLSWRTTEASLDLLKLLGRHGSEQFDYGSLGYNDIRWIIHALQLTARDVVYDLGAGYGRFMIYGAVVSPARFKGIEIVRERAAHIERAQARFGLRNMSVVTNNAVAEDLTDGTKFYLFSPFFMPTLQAVSKKLQACAVRRSITIVAFDQAAAFFARQRWLKRATASTARQSAEVPLGLKLLVSRPKSAIG